MFRLPETLGNYSIVITQNTLTDFTVEVYRTSGLNPQLDTTLSAALDNLIYTRIYGQKRDGTRSKYRSSIVYEYMQRMAEVIDTIGCVKKQLHAHRQLC